jgi:metal-dependent amidase/aminoacylase/carboxypeptidase family protein
MRYLALSVVLAACADPAPAPLPPFAAIEASAVRLESGLVALRRDLHRNPELSGAEQRTASRIAGELRALGLEVRTGVGGHGVVGVLQGALPGPVVAYRADMDAMPGDEPSGRAYGSLVPGVFHICGHDVHAAIGVGVASVLAAERERLPGSVVFLFQPAEETIEGAAAMLAAGVFDERAPDAIFAVHSFPFPVGTIARNVDFGGLDQFVATLPAGVDAGSIERAVARLQALGTAERPGPGDVASYLDQLRSDPSPLAGAVYMDVETESDEEAGALGGVRIEGSWRAEDDSMYPALRAEIESILRAELGLNGLRLEFRAAPFPSMRSDPGETERASVGLGEVVGDGQVLALHGMHLFSGEDFALFLQRAPGAMFLVGVANAERGIVGAPHFPDFDVDEAAIGIATRAMSWIVWRRLAGL